MSQRRPTTPAPDPLEKYCAHFDPLFSRLSQRESFRRYLEGLLLPQERNKTLTALANAQPIVGAQNPHVQTLQWFLSESDWEPALVNARRLELLRADPLTAPQASGALIIDETGDRKDGKRTAHVARQYLANLGKVDNGVVSVTSLFAQERVYYPLAFEPYTPSCWFARGKNDPAFRTKPQIALELVDKAVATGIAFGAVVADSFYGENAEFSAGLDQRGVGYVLALRPSHAWWHLVGTMGSLVEVVQASAWRGAQDPGDWIKVVRPFGDGRTEHWWVLEAACNVYGPDKARRAVVATTDPSSLPEASTWYLMTNLPAPGSLRAHESLLAAASLGEVVRLFGLRLWVEQSYKQVKHALGWAKYQVRGDLAIRRHWALVCCAFSFCWWHQRFVPEQSAPSIPAGDRSSPVLPACAPEAGGGGKPGSSARGLAPGFLAGGAAFSAGVAGALDHAGSLLARVVVSAPAGGVSAAT